MSPVQDLVAQFQDAVSPAVVLLERHPAVRWSLLGVFWGVVVLRLFGRGAGQRRGLFSWYDWFVVLGGMGMLWYMQFGTRLPWR